MKKVLFLTNYPSPYRVCFFDELGKYAQVTVLASNTPETAVGREAAWFVEGQGGHTLVHLSRKGGNLMGETLCWDVLDWVKKDFDAIVVGGYSNPTIMLAMVYMRLKKIPFYMEVDGGLIRQESRAKFLFKKTLVSGAAAWISSGPYSTNYLCHYGAKREKVYEYPFTSLWQRDILKTVPGREEKLALRRTLGMEEEKVLLYVGRFDPEKGMDDLLHAAREIDPAVGIYFIGGEAAREHLDFCEEHQLKNVHFVGFQKKEALEEYYRAADLLVLPTHSDVWGLVVNEAMAKGLPVITTDQCVAGVELIEDGVNGCLIPARDPRKLAQGISRILAGDYEAMGAAALETIRPYTLENMAKVHADIFENGR